MTATTLHYGKDLLQEVAKGDEKAFRALFDAYHNRLYFYCLQLTHSKEMAEDIVQDTFLKIWMRRDLLVTIEHFNAYIFQMAQNAILNGLRRNATEAAILKRKPDQQMADPEPADALHVKLIKEVLQKVINTLPDQQKRVYKLRREEGYHIREIAKAMNISEVTVKRHLGEAQKTLRKAMLTNFPYEAGALLLIFGLIHPA